MTANRDQDLRRSTPEPEFRAPQRARLILEFVEDGQPHHSSQDGWARLDGHWVHWLDDDWDRWQSWPMDNVICIDWEVPDAF